MRMSRLNRILIVEDEPMISMMLENFLDCLDREVAGSADNVQDALRLVACTEIDAVILDLHLRNGEKSTPVAVELMSRGIPFIVASGGSLAMEDVFEDAPVLSKPFNIQSMEDALTAIEKDSLAIRAA